MSSHSLFLWKVKCESVYNLKNLKLPFNVAGLISKYQKEVNKKYSV